jgi:hypothetical protein
MNRGASGGRRRRAGSRAGSGGCGRSRRSRWRNHPRKSCKSLRSRELAVEKEAATSLWSGVAEPKRVIPGNGAASRVGTRGCKGRPCSAKGRSGHCDFWCSAARQIEATALAVRKANQGIATSRRRDHPEDLTDRTVTCSAKGQSGHCDLSPKSAKLMITSRTCSAKGQSGHCDFSSRILGISSLVLQCERPIRALRLLLRVSSRGEQQGACSAKGQSGHCDSAVIVGYTRCPSRGWLAV